MANRPNFRGLHDSGNSSLTKLAAGATFTGNSRGCVDYSRVGVFVDTDVDGTLFLELSADGVNWDRAKAARVDQDISSGGVHQITTASPFYRTRYVNGPVAQSHFRLATIFFPRGSNFLTSSSDQVISGADDVQLVRSANDAKLDLARGLIADKIAVAKFGSNESVGTSAFEIIAPQGGAPVLPLAAETIRIQAGGDADDDAAGVGARSVIVEALVNWEPVTITLTTAGASASAASSELVNRINRAYVGGVGAYDGSNTGVITIENTTSGDTLTTIGAGAGQSESAQYTVRAGYDAYLSYALFEVASNKTATIRMCQRRDADVVSSPFAPVRIVHRIFEASGVENWIPGVYIQFPEKTDIWIEAEASSQTAAVNARFDLELARNVAAATPQL